MLWKGTQIGFSLHTRMLLKRLKGIYTSSLRWSGLDLHVCVLQPCWPAVQTSSSVATVPASTEPNSATRSTTVSTTAMSPAASTVGLPRLSSPPSSVRLPDQVVFWLILGGFKCSGLKFHNCSMFLCCFTVFSGFDRSVRSDCRFEAFSGP